MKFRIIFDKYINSYRVQKKELFGWHNMCIYNSGDYMIYNNESTYVSIDDAKKALEKVEKFLNTKHNVVVYIKDIEILSEKKCTCDGIQNKNKPYWKKLINKLF